MIKKIGFVINPIAGMGGKVGLKGTDGVLKEAISLGAKPVSIKKSEETIKEYLSKYSKNKEIRWITCSDEMGESTLRKLGIKQFEIIYPIIIFHCYIY